MVYAGKYRTEDKLKIHTIHKLNTTQKKHSMQNTAKHNYPAPVDFYNTRSGNELGLFYNAPSPHGPSFSYILQNDRIKNHCNSNTV